MNAPFARLVLAAMLFATPAVALAGPAGPAHNAPQPHNGSAPQPHVQNAPQAHR